MVRVKVSGCFTFKQHNSFKVYNNSRPNELCPFSGSVNEIYCQTVPKNSQSIKKISHPVFPSPSSHLTFGMCNAH